MTAFHCDKLCSGACCEWVRIWCDVMATRPVFATAVECPVGGCASCYARNALVDPAKLAELLVLAMRARGLDLHAFVAFDGERVVVANPLGHGPRLALPQARALLARIMATPPDESSRAQVEALYRCESGPSAA